MPRWILSIIALHYFLVGSAVSANEEAAEVFQPLVDHIVASYNAGEFDAMRRDFSPAMAEALSAERGRQFFGDMLSQAGKIVEVGAPVMRNERLAEYPLTLEQGLLTLKLTLSEAGEIDGLLLTPRQAEFDVPKRNATSLGLPFSGEWFVFWGGDTKEQNYHVETPNQRHAFDFVMVGSDGKSHQGNGARNEDYYCYGEPLLAPAEGEVVQVVRGVRDNVPGSMNPYLALGNAVVVKHRENEYSVFAHLQMGSALVEVGDSVSRGQQIGKCGNSGNSTEPHLHYHLQHSPVIQDGLGIKCYFDNVKVRSSGEAATKDGYSPVKGDHVQPVEN